MSINRRLGVILACIPILLVLATVAIVLNNKSNTKDDKWTNIADVSDEFLNKYFDEYTEMRRDADPDNILMVTSKTEPKAYGASKVVEAPNYLYILQYDSNEERDMAFENLKSDGMVVEKNQTMQVMGQYLSWGIEKMNLDDAITNINSRENVNDVTVAVIDTGMDMEAFRHYFPTRRIVTYCVVECDGGMDDRNDNMHGTHVGGTVVEGTGSNVQLMAIKVTNEANGILTLADTVTAINYAVANSADVINLSLGGAISDTSHPDAIAEKNALDAAAAAGVVNVASAGNSNTNTPFYPASFDSALSVAAVDSSLNRWVESSNMGSNYGDNIDFAAPGSRIDGINDYLMSGTSMAAPHISAAVANLKSINKTIKQDDAKDLLKTIATDIGTTGWDQYYGWGFVDFNNAEFCDSDSTCDKFGIFKADFAVDDKTNGVATYNIKDSVMTVTSEKAAMVIADTTNGYARISAVATANSNVYTFDLSNCGSSELILVLVGDVNMNGTVNTIDSSRIKKSTLLETNSNYQALTALERVIADVNNNGTVNTIDSSKVKKSTLLETNSNYAPLPW